MKTIRELNIKDWSGHFFEEMINILDIDPGYFEINDTKECTDDTIIYNICYNDKFGVPHIVFNNIDCYFLKNKWNSSLIFCDNNENKIMINIYFKIIKQLRDEVFSLIDEFEDGDFIFADDFTRSRFIKNDNVIDYDDNDEDDDSLINFRFKTDDNLLYNKKINIAVLKKYKKFLYEYKRWKTLLIIKRTEISY